MDFLNSQATSVLSKALDGVSQRHKAIVSNIANADTPNYHKMTVSFEDELKAALQEDKTPNASSLAMTKRGHLGGQITFTSIDQVQPTWGQSNLEFRQDGNGVDIDREMADLSRNSGKYGAYSKLESRLLNQMKSVIKGGGG
jgi:flagellar basal-body rod protein FlgB